MSKKPTYEELQKRVKKLEASEIESRKAQKALLESQNHFALIVKTSIDGIYKMDSSGKFLFVNKAFLKIFGYQGKDILGKQFSKILGSEIQRGEGFFNKLISGKSIQNEIYVKHKDGHEFPIYFSAVPIRNGTKVLGLTGILTDVSMLKRSEEALKKSEEMLKKAQSIAKMGFLDWNVKTNDIFWCDEIFRLFGIKRTTKQSLDTIIALVYPDDLDFVQKNLDLAVKGDKEYNIQHRVLRPDGKVIWVQTHSELVRDVDGNPERLIGTVVDITNSKQIEEALKESEARYHDFYDNSPDMYASVDPKTAKIIQCNQTLADNLGYKKEEIIGRHIHDMYHADVLDRARKVFQEFVETGKVHNAELQLKRKDGSKLDVALEVTSIRDGQGNIIASRSAWRDISERKRAEEEKENLLNNLKQVQKMEAIGSLAGGIAHDFNNILASIIGFTQLSISKVQKDSKTYASLNQVLDSALRGRELVKYILTFSRKTEQEVKLVQLPKAIKEVLKLIKPTIPSTIEICQNIDKNSGWVMADLAQIQQIFLNLCINAEHAMREKGGVLGVSLESVHINAGFNAIPTHLKEGAYLKLSVSDTGHGMSKEITEQIFKPFFTTKSAGEGTGLGLATVHGIVLSLEGGIIVNSELGKGSTFVVYLPKTKNALTKKSQKSIPIPRGNERILFVDDEEDLVSLGKKMLEGLGYSVVTKTNSMAALECFRTDPQLFDIVITDQTMPGMTGDVLARELMKLRPEIPVILYTGFSHTITPEKAKSIGIREFIMKPFLTSEIASTLRKVLDQKTN